MVASGEPSGPPLARSQTVGSLTAWVLRGYSNLA